MGTHRRFSPEFKLRVMMEVVTGARRPSEVCREHVMKLCRSYPTATVCRALGVPRSSVYCRRRQRDDAELKTKLVDVAGKWPTYGYRRLTEQLAREGVPLNRKQRRRPR